MKWNITCPNCYFHYGNKTKKDKIRCCKCGFEYPIPEKKKKEKKK